MPESSTKPYLIRALHEWCTDNGYTPHIVVTVDANTVVPRAHIHDGQITLNIGSLATNQLVLGNDYIEFQARFGGAAEQVYRSEEHTSELQSLMRRSYAVFCLKKKTCSTQERKR